MPSILQTLVLIFARLIQTNPKEIIEFLSETSIDNRICLKIVLDKWLLQQALFRGQYTKTVTISALCKLFLMREPHIETLMVIGYNPSHSNVNSEVNAPFKMLSILLRFLSNEQKPTNKRPLRKPLEDYNEDPCAMGSQGLNQQSAFGSGYSMSHAAQSYAEELKQDSGARIDTYNDGDSYGDDCSYGSDDRRFGELADEDKLDVDLDDLEDNNSEDEVNLDRDNSNHNDVDAEKSKK